MEVSKIQKTVESVFGLKPEEQRVTALLLFCSVALVGGLVITGNVVGRSLFLSAIPKSAIALKFILPPLATVMVAARYSGLADKYRTDKLILWTQSFVVVCLLLFRVGLASPIGDHVAFLCGLFVFFDVAVSISMLQYWTLAGELFDPRQAKRVFPVITTGGTIASILFGSLLHQLAKVVQGQDLIFLMILCLLGANWAVRNLRKHSTTDDGSPKPKDKSEAKTGLKKAFKALRSSPLLLSISLLVVLVAQVSSIVDYQLDLALQDYFGQDTESMVSFLGSFRFWTGLAAAAIQFFLASRLFAKFGLKIALLILPLCIGVGSAGILITGGILWAVIMPRATDLVFKYTINQTAFNLLYLPVNPQMQRQAKVLISGMLNPAMVCFLGLSFYLVERYLSWPLPYWSALVLCLVSAWIFTAQRAMSHYVKELNSSIRWRTLESDWETAALVDDNTKNALIKSLEADDPILVVHSLELMEQIPEIDWTDSLETVLGHEHPDVQIQAFRLVEKLKYEKLKEKLLEIESDKEARVTAARLSSYCALVGDESVEAIQPYLEAKAPETRAAAITGLISFGGLDGVLQAAPVLKEMVESDCSEDKIQAAGILGQLQAKSFHKVLKELLADENLEVKKAAAKSAALLKLPEFQEALLTGLTCPTLRSSHARALLACLDENLLVLREALFSQTCLPQSEKALLWVMSKHPQVESVKILEEYLTQSEPRFLGRASRSLLKLRSKGLPVQPPQDLLDKLILSETESAIEMRELKYHCNESSPLHSALQLRFEQARDRVLNLVDLKHPEITLHKADLHFQKSDSRAAAYAVELLDNVLESKLKTPVLALFSEKSEAEAEVDDSVLVKMAAAEDILLRVCCLWELAEKGDPKAIPIAKRELKSDSSVLRDTAWKVTQKLISKSDFQSLREDHPDYLKDTPYLSSLHPQKGSTTLSLSNLEELLFLRTVPLFAELSTEDLIGIVPITNEVRFEQGETLIKAGDSGDCLFVIVEGEVQVSKEGEEVSVCSSPATLGELSILGERPRSADCRALTDVLALRLDKDDFSFLLDDQPEIAKGLIQVLLGYVD